MDKTPTIGTVIHGTLRTEDLIKAFAATLRAITSHTGNLTLADEADALTDFDNDEADGILADLFDILNDYAPPNTYFGAHEGDGSDFGFWPVEE